MKHTDTHIYFWSGEFSNWDYSPFIVDENSFSNSEQYFMYKKAKFFGDSEIAMEILKTPDPRENKELGRKVKNFDYSKWVEVSSQFMIEACMHKFMQNDKHRQTLLNSEDKILVEASPLDTVWGVGLHFTDPLILDEKNWGGKNLLGKTLMEVRTRLKNMKEFL